MWSAYFKIWFLAAILALVVCGYSYGGEANDAVLSGVHGRSDGNVVVTCFIPEENIVSQPEVDNLMLLWQTYLFKELADKKLSRVYLLQKSRRGVVFTFIGMQPGVAASNAQRISRKLEQIASDNKLDLKDVCSTHQLEG